MRRGSKPKLSPEYLAYAQAHPFCEADDCRQASISPHHIRSRGAHGNIDDSKNLIALCWRHTYGPGGVHGLNGGNRAFAKKYPKAGKKIKAALRRRL